MTIRQQIVHCVVSCILAFSGPASAAENLWLASDINDPNRPDGRSVSCVPVVGGALAHAFPGARGFKGGGNLQSPDVSRGYITLTAVPEPAAALIGSLGLLALVRRRRG